MLRSSFLINKWQRGLGLAVNQQLELGERRFRALIQASAQVVWVADPHGRCIEDSPSWRSFTGMTYEEYHGSGWLDGVHPEDRERAAVVWGQAVRTRARYEITYRLRHASGGWRHTRARGIPMLAVNGDVQCWVGLNDDVTAQVEAEAALAESELQFRTLASSVPNFIWIADADAQVFFWNETWYEYTGRTPENCAGIQAAEAIADEYRSSVLEAWLDAVKRGVPLEIDFPLRRWDGVYRWFTARARPMKTDEGRIIRWCGVIFDIDDRRRANEALREERAIREQFVCALVHDLKNIFATNRSAAEQLLSGDLTKEDQVEFKRLWSNSVSTAERMIEDLLDANQLEAGQAYAIRDPERFELATFVWECVRTAIGPAALGRVHVRIDAGLVVRWSAPDVARVLQNLLTNAVKYGDHNREMTVDARLDPERSRVHLGVHNWGAPISPEDQLNIFGFLKRGATRGQRGWGIGLTLVRGIVDAHGGSLSVSSSENLGTRFTIDMPVEAG